MAHTDTYHNEADIPGADASADAQTLLAVESSADGENQAHGVISSEADTDWVAVELSEGTLYTLTVTGDGDGGLADPVLELLDADGNVLAMNDDMDAGNGQLDSQLQFAPAAGSGTQVYYVSISAHDGHLGVDHMGAYELTVAETLTSSDVGPDITGSELADKLVGTVAAEKIMGLGGNDILSAGHGDDELYGGDGNDGLRGGPGADTLSGGEGFDLVYYLDSPAGVSVNLADNTAGGGTAEGDTLGGDIEIVVGSDYADMLTGDDLVNVLWGFGGDDALDGGGGDDVLNGGDDNDGLSGGDGADVLNGNDGDDRLEGGPGADVLQGGPGADVLVGNDGRDAVSYAASMAGVTVNLGTARLAGGDAEGDVFGNMVTVELMTFATDGSDSIVTDTETVPDIQDIVGSAYADVLFGDSRDNTILGGAGDDMLYGGLGISQDVISGGDGDDEVFGGLGDDGLFGDAGNDLLEGGAGADRLHGGDGDDLFLADADDSMIDGGAGADTLSFQKVDAGVELDLSRSDTVIGIENLTGTVMADTLTGDDGDNLLEGLAGADVLSGGAGTDTLSYEHSNRGVHVDLSDHSASGGHAGGDRIDGFENVVGSSHKDVLSGSDAANRLWGLDGDDTLSGEDGDDQLAGGAGHDILHGNAGRDDVSGGAGDDDIYGGDGNDMLDGGEGNDLLYGLGGDDMLDGGPGSDIYVFAPGNGEDVINHFMINYAAPFAGVPGDIIDLTAFDLDKSELLSLLSPVPAGDGTNYTHIDLSGHGGGEIVVHNDILLVPEERLVAFDHNNDGDYSDLGDFSGVFIL